METQYTMQDELKEEFIISAVWEIIDMIKTWHTLCDVKKCWVVKHLIQEYETKKDLINLLKQNEKENNNG